jgi:hypothetical protein
MAYREFSLIQVKRQFKLQEKEQPLFPNVQPVSLSNWLTESLDMGIKLALTSSSEKARSEFIVAPILLELEKNNVDHVSIFSGIRLDVDEASGLKGECDFIVSRKPLQSSLEAPIFCLVEAKKNDISDGLGQCIAQMLGAQKFNEINQETINTIYGCVTTGEAWQFLKLTGNFICFDQKRYYLSELNQILGILQFLIDESGN